jgi:lipid-A-disaccharide synthase
VLPTVPHIASQLRDTVAGWTTKPRIVVDPAEKRAAFRKARAALAASGTVTLELALSGVPMVAAYRLHALEAMVARLIRLQANLPSVILANLVIGENVVPEFLQEDCTADKLAAALSPLLSDSPERRRQIEGFRRLDDIMAVEAGAPSAKAAAIVLETARQGRRATADTGEAARPC